MAGLRKRRHAETEDGASDGNAGYNVIDAWYNVLCGGGDNSSPSPPPTRRRRANPESQANLSAEAIAVHESIPAEDDGEGRAEGFRAATESGQQFLSDFTSRAEECLLCKYGSVEFDRGPHGHGLWKTMIAQMSQNLPLITPQQNARNVVDFYQQTILPYLTRYRRSDDPPLPQAHYQPILEHLSTSSHTLNPQLMHINQIRLTDRVIYSLVDEIESTEEVGLKMKCVEQLRKHTALLLQLYKEKPAHLAYSTESRLEMEQVPGIDLVPASHQTDTNTTTTNTQFPASAPDDDI